MQGGEIYVKKIPSMNIIEIAKAVAPNARHEIIGVRPGEKLHEQMIGLDDASHTYEYSEHFKILPAIHEWSRDPFRIKDGVKVRDDFVYASDKNKDWMTIPQLQAWITANADKIGIS
jgi:FlaA1/EpsC-like NDP-sugar epimerase